MAAQRLLMEILTDLRTKRIELRGFTDALGGEGYNDQLALRRARQVQQYLIEHGIPGPAITINGDGKCCYVSPNESDESRRRNRRVEIHLIAG